MRIRNVDKNGDWTFGQSSSNYVKNEYSVLLDIQMKLKEWYQDCFFALTNGIPWNIRLGEHNQKNLLDNDIQTVAESVEGVLNISDFNSITDGRRYRAQFNVYTLYSTEPLPVNFDSQEII